MAQGSESSCQLLPEAGKVIGHFKFGVTAGIVLSTSPLRRACVSIN